MLPGTRFTDVRRLGSVDSTNRYLLDEARSGAPEGTVAVADYQTAGRGRLGRRWEAPAGANLLASVLLRPELGPDERHLAAACVALAAADAAGAVAGVELGVKWPNDLLGSDGRKVAGVLAEADVTPPARTGPPPAVVVGIGLNVNWPAGADDLPPELAGTAGSLRWEVGRPVDRDRLLEALLAALEPRVADLGTEPGRARQATELRARCTTLGTPVRVELPEGVVEGTALDLTPAGHLVVGTGQGTRTVLAGDVVHLRAGSPEPLLRRPPPGRL